jgi:hypothetical protein
MKEAFSLATFALGVLCFAAFVTTAKPTAISAIQAAPDYCQTDPSGMRGCDLHAFAAVSGAVGRPVDPEGDTRNYDFVVGDAHKILLHARFGAHAGKYESVRWWETFPGKRNDRVEGSILPLFPKSLISRD